MAKKTVKKAGGAKKAGARMRKAGAETVIWKSTTITTALDTALDDLRANIRANAAGWNHRQKMKIAMCEAALKFARSACNCTSSSMSLP